MKLFKRLVIAGTDYPLVKDNTVLDLSTPGRGAYTVNASHALSGVVELHVGYDPENMCRYFLGFVVTSTRVNDSEQRIFCRELSAALDRLYPLSIRHASAQSVLDAMASQSQLNFVLPEQDYANTVAPYFYTVCGGYQVMDNIGSVFEIPQYIWQQAESGHVFAGSWAHSIWADKEIELPALILDQHGIANTARVGALPKLRPGAWLNAEAIITQVTLNGNYMHIEWDKNPW